MADSVYSHLLNPKLIEMAKENFSKQAFIPAGDPSQGMGGMGGGDPSGGAAPPPSGGGAPPPGGGAPPPDPSGGSGGGGGSHLEMILQKLNQMGMQQGGGAPGSGAALKPKIDVNVELMQIKNMLAKICDHLQIHIPAQDMTATPDKLMAMSQGQPTTADPNAGGAGAGGGAIGGIDPMGGMQGAGVPGAQKTAKARGRAFETTPFAEMHNFATALGAVMGKA